MNGYIPDFVGLVVINLFKRQTLETLAKGFLFVRLYAENASNFSDAPLGTFDSNFNFSTAHDCFV